MINIKRLLLAIIVVAVVLVAGTVFVNDVAVKDYIIGVEMIEWDIEELAYRAMGKSESETEDAVNDGDIEDAIYEKYEVSFSAYCQIVKDLLPFTQIVESPLSGSQFHAFVDNAQSRAIVKMEVKNEIN